MEHSIRQITLEEFNAVESLFEKNQKELNIYADLLVWWNKKINLVSRDVSRETIILHIKHSLLISSQKSFLDGESFLDTGAGGGLPGLPLSLCFQDKRFILNDIVTKKIFATNDMINKLGLNKTVRGLASDVSKVELEKNTVIITKHAFKVDQLFEMVKAKPWKRIVFLKGAEEALEEAGGINEPVKLDIIRLDSEFMPTFYEGKGIVELERLGNE